MRHFDTRMGRRRLLQTAAVGAAGVAAPYVVTSAALGAAGRAPASERITVGTIGCGGRGSYDRGAFLWHADVQVVAVCDVKGPQRRAGQKAVEAKYGPGTCAAYIDLRELLAREDLDAVLIATGENWHAPASILAARAGKDIYCEKPMCMTIAEGRAVVEAVRRHDVVYQCGTQRRNLGRFRFAVDLARRGVLGELKELYAEKTPWPEELDRSTLSPQPAPPREELDWDLWLGPAPWRPYNPGYLRWENRQDLGLGVIPGWGSHTADLCQWANDADDSAPVEYWHEDGTIVGRYANGVKLIFEKGAWPLHVRFVGTEGWVYADDDGGVRAEPESLLAFRKFGKGYPADDHVREFIDCVKSRRRPTSHAEASHRSMTANHCAIVCKELRRPVRWDPAAEEFPGDDEANRLRARAHRVWGQGPGSTESGPTATGALPPERRG